MTPSSDRPELRKGKATGTERLTGAPDASEMAMVQKQEPGERVTATEIRSHGLTPFPCDELRDYATGIHYGISREEYGRIKAINQTLLKKILPANGSPAEFRADQLGLLPPKESKVFAFGTAWHTYVLEGVEVFVDRYLVTPKVDLRTKKGKANWAAFLITAQGREILDAEDWERAKGMGEAVRTHPAASRLFERGPETECAIVWRDAITGELCKCLLDCLIDDDWITAADLKSAISAAAGYFARQLANYDYAFQAAFYLSGVRAILGDRDCNFVFVPCEKEARQMNADGKLVHGCATWQVGPRTLRKGWEHVREALELNAKFKQDNNWPGYSDDVQELEAPTWYLK